MTEIIKYLNKGWKQNVTPKMKQCIKLVIILKCRNVFGKNYTGKIYTSNTLLYKYLKWIYYILIIVYNTYLRQMGGQRGKI